MTELLIPFNSPIIIDVKNILILPSYQLTNYHKEGLILCFPFFELPNESALFCKTYSRFRLT